MKICERYQTFNVSQPSTQLRDGHRVPDRRSELAYKKYGAKWTWQGRGSSPKKDKNQTANGYGNYWGKIHFGDGPGSSPEATHQWPSRLPTNFPGSSNESGNLFLRTMRVWWRSGPNKACQADKEAQKNTKSTRQRWPDNPDNRITRTTRTTRTTRITRHPRYPNKPTKRKSFRAEIKSQRVVRLSRLAKLILLIRKTWKVLRLDSRGRTRPGRLSPHFSTKRERSETAKCSCYRSFDQKIK